MLAIFVISTHRSADYILVSWSEGPTVWGAQREPHVHLPSSYVRWLSLSVWISPPRAPPSFLDQSEPGPLPLLLPHSPHCNSTLCLPVHLRLALLPSRNHHLMTHVGSQLRTPWLKGFLYVKQNFTYHDHPGSINEITQSVRRIK
jgi:hypothetical protein